MSSGIRLVIFDLGKVLVDFEQDQIAYRLMARAKKNFTDILNYYRETKIFNEFECGRITPGDALKSINRALGTDLSMDEFRPLWSDIFSEIPEMSDVVKHLRGRYKLCLLSDTNVLHYEHILERFPVTSLIDDHVLSFRVGVRKPDPKMYQTALGCAGASPEQTVFIDDKKKNVEGARRLGITAIQHRSAAETRAALKKLGILKC